MQQAIFKVNAVKRVAKIYIKIMFKIWQLRQRDKTKSKNGTKYVENVVQNWYLKLYKATNIEMS